ncbi:hypothetical protein ACOTH1_05970 [Achromobacter ruhlandii]|uniref:hypothetical protein n=1 Tax=Achromobacter ruhlandii TaxID=72557 RepID=UPI003B9BC75F
MFWFSAWFCNSSATRVPLHTKPVYLCISRSTSLFYTRTSADTRTKIHAAPVTANWFDKWFEQALAYILEIAITIVLQNMGKNWGPATGGSVNGK